MASKKKTTLPPIPFDEKRPSAIAYALGPGRLVTVSVGFALLIALSAIWAWSNYAHRLSSDPDYVVVPDRIELTPAPPSGLPEDIKLQALRVASLDGALPLLDHALAPRLAQAFALHPWIEQVTRVEKSYPAHVSVSVRYRGPVLLVDVRNETFAVDRNGVLLPGEDVRRLDTSNTPRLAGVNNPPASPTGLPWGDAQIHSAARLAAYLSDQVWVRFGMASMRGVSPSSGVAAAGRLSPLTTSSAAVEFEIQTRDGLRILWGHAPGDEIRGEARAEQKLRDMAGYFARSAGRDAPAAPAFLDLRTPFVAMPVESIPEIVGFGAHPR